MIIGKNLYENYEDYYRLNDYLTVYKVVDSVIIVRSLDSTIQIQDISNIDNNLELQKNEMYYIRNEDGKVIITTLNDNRNLLIDTKLDDLLILESTRKSVVKVVSFPFSLRK